MTFKELIHRNMGDIVLIILIISVIIGIVNIANIVYNHDVQMAKLGYVEQAQPGTRNTVWIKPKD